MNNLLATTSALLPCVIAQVPVASGAEVLTVLLSGAALVVIANQVLTFWKKINPGEQPPPSQTYVSLTNCEKAHRAAEAEAYERRKELLGEIKGIRAAIELFRKEDEERARNVHRRIDGISERTSELNGTLNTHIQNGGHHA